MTTWRQIAKPIISKVLRENEGEDVRAIKKALREVYPFGERKYHPYKIWCDEIRVQLGLKEMYAPKHGPEQMTF